MKKVILASLTILFGIAAQAQPGPTGNVTLNVKLYPIQTLVVNPAQEVVNLEYHTEADYANGVSSNVLQDHLSVYSTGGFTVSVKSATAHLTNTVAANVSHGDIEANSIQIIPTNGTKPIEGVTNTTIPLSGTEQTIVSSVYGAVNKTINVEYKGAGADAYINYYVAGQTPASVYTTQLTYTILAL